MSIDCEVWIRRPLEVTVALYAASEDWHGDADVELVLDGDGWQLLVSPPEPANPTTADPDIAAILGDRTSVVYVTLEGASDGPGRIALTATVRRLVERCAGVARDPESGDLLAVE